MIIVDKALEARAEQGKPIKVAILGGGFMAQGLTNQIVNSVPGNERWWPSTAVNRRRRSMS